jgi:hypothetical protein
MKLKSDGSLVWEETGGNSMPYRANAGAGLYTISVDPTPAALRHGALDIIDVNYGERCIGSVKGHHDAIDTAKAIAEWHWATRRVTPDPVQPSSPSLHPSPQ